jgi:FKBP-type peptidyl-prolyl cis-trans isomerase FkpA
MIRLTLIAFVSGLACAGCSGSSTSPTANVPYSATDLRVGTGADAIAGRTATVTYTGWLYSASAAENKGSRFDGGTLTFVLGSGQVISGFDQGVTGMKVDGQRRVVIPPSLGYGSQAQGPIPANSTLVFDLELVSLR